jgi:hypothetical protein
MKNFKDYLLEKPYTELTDVEKGKYSELFNFITRQFDVSYAKNWIRNNPDKVTITKIDVDKWAEWITHKEENPDGSYKISPGINVDDKWAKTRKMQKLPIILADREGEFVFMIDGWHRLRKAQMEGLKEIYAHVIEDKDAIDKIKL